MKTPRCGRCHIYGHTTSGCRTDRTLTPADLTPCTRCHLRGHTAGDADRCLYYRGSLGMGGQAAMVAQAGHGKDNFDSRRRDRRKGDPYRRSHKGGEVRPARPA